MSKHAICVASSSQRWLKCPRSCRLEEKCPDNSGTAAQEGTTAHAVCEYRLHKFLGRKCREVKSLDKAMDDYCDGYVAFVAEQMARFNNPAVLIEQKLDFSKFVPQGFGTGDCVISDGETIHIIDFKYGFMEVTAEKNSQLMLYGLGALELFPDAKKIIMTIYQPRRSNISTYEMTNLDLLYWGEYTLKPAARKAFDGKGEFACGEWCNFCRAATKCRKRAEENLELGSNLRRRAEFSATRSSLWRRLNSAPTYR